MGFRIKGIPTVRIFRVYVARPKLPSNVIFSLQCYRATSDGYEFSVFFSYAMFETGTSSIVTSGFTSGRSIGPTIRCLVEPVIRVRVIGNFPTRGFHPFHTVCMTLGEFFRQSQSYLASFRHFPTQGSATTPFEPSAWGRDFTRFAASNNSDDKTRGFATP